jgi:hypothetical protein
MIRAYNDTLEVREPKARYSGTGEPYLLPTYFQLSKTRAGEGVKNAAVQATSPTPHDS